MAVARGASFGGLEILTRNRNIQPKPSGVPLEVETLDHAARAASERTEGGTT